MEGFLEFAALRGGGVPEILMVLPILVLVSESFDGLWSPQHKVAFYLHENAKRTGVETSNSFLIFPWMLAQRRALVLFSSFSSILSDKVNPTTYLYGLYEILSPT